MLFTHHSAFPWNILNYCITIIFHLSKLLHWKHLVKLKIFVFNLKNLLSHGLEIATQTLAFPSQRCHKVISPASKCSLTSPWELDQCLEASQLIPQQDLEQEINATGNKLQGELCLWISCTHINAVTFTIWSQTGWGLLSVFFCISPTIEHPCTVTGHW